MAQFFGGFLQLVSFHSKRHLLTIGSNSLFSSISVGFSNKNNIGALLIGKRADKKYSNNITHNQNVTNDAASSLIMCIKWYEQQLQQLWGV